MMTETDIIEAIQKDQFNFYYQPKVSLITGRVIGAEALIRWIRPDGVVVLPGAFIPLAERSSLIKRITKHMIPKLMSDLMLLSDMEPLSFSFNASAKDFEDDVFTNLLLHLLEVSHLPAKSLQVELTETALLGASGQIKPNILLLREAGVGLAMDDFGQGYSSIDTLSQWPFTAIKLDYGIINRMLDSEKNATIVASSVRMAHELNISVVAEGVETKEQYHQLLTTGCTAVQGFWISQPLPLSEFISFVEQDVRWSGLPVGLIHLAIFDHVQWRKKLVSEVIKLAVLPKKSPYRQDFDMPPMSCKECRLGRWYYGEGRIFADLRSYRDLEKPHHDFHEIGQKLVQLVAEGAGIEDLAPSLRELSEYSMDVLSQLQILENEGLLDMHAANHIL